MEQENQHRMYRAVACPELKSVKRLCMYIIVVCIGILMLCIKYPWLWDFGNTIYAWIIMGIIALYVAVKALRAAAIQSYYNSNPWEQEGAERP